MQHIPISFDYRGQHYEGYFDEISGAGAEIGRMWYLCLKRDEGYYHRGQLIFNVRNEFVFYSNDHMFEDLAEWFGEQIMLWYE